MTPRFDADSGHAGAGASVVGMTPRIPTPRADDGPETATRPPPRDAAGAGGGSAPRPSSCSAARCSWSAPPTARAPTCAPAATPTWPRSRSTEADQYDALEQRVADLNAEVEPADRVASTTGRQPVQPPDRAARGPGRPDPAVRTRASPSRCPTRPRRSSTRRTQDLNLLVVHQQDIQAVVNAMWKGGATAVTVQGQRIVTTTGIKCEGNAVQLQGVPYPQPYVIEAVGDQTELLGAIERRRLPRRSTASRPRSPTSRSAGTSSSRRRSPRRRTTACST